MGIQDRDYHREHVQRLEREADLTVNQKLKRRFLIAISPKTQPHWVLTMLSTAFICFGVYGLLRLVVYLARHH